jgi:Cof subfamily protein (haloacid dehalogenase superfamily)
VSVSLPPAPRAVACDLDGTVLRSDLTVSARTRAALAAVEAAGALLVLVTGRPPRWIAPVSEQTDHRGLAICANGALLYDLHTEQVVAADLLSVAVLARTIATLRTAVPDLAFAVEYGADFAHEAAYPVAQAHVRADVRMVSEAELITRAAAKLLVRHPERDSADLLDAAAGCLGELVEVTHSTPAGPGLLEISAGGVSKATALARLCAQHDIDAADVVAFGDMPNDLPMLTWAGRPYAMSNAHPDVLARVAGRAPSNDADGVAVVLERLFA